MNLGMRMRLAAMAMFGPSSSVSDSNGWFIRAIGGGKTKAGVPVNEWTATNLVAVWSCVTLIADAIAMLPTDLFERKGNRRNPVTSHPSLAFLNGSVNPDMDASTLTAASMMHKLLWGNGYSEIQVNGKGEPIALWPLLPDRTYPDLRLDGGRRLQYRTTVDGKGFTIPQDRVLHLKGQTFDGIVGLSPVTIARQAIGMALAMEEFGAKYFANDAKSGGFMMHPGKLSTKAKTNIADSYDGDQQGGQGGLDNAHRVKVLEEGMKFVPTTIPPEDSQFLGSREFQIAEIARLYRVPLILLQSHEKTTSWGSGIEQLLIGFVVWTVQPHVTAIERELGRKLLTDADRARGLFFKLNVSALLRGDMAAQSALFHAGITDGWMVRNEARALRDMNPLPGLDEPLIQSTMQPASQAGQQAAGAAPPDPPGGGDGGEDPDDEEVRDAA